MKLVEFVPPRPHLLWKLCLQMGITEVVVKIHPELTGIPDPWRFESLSKIVEGLKTEGLTVIGIEGDPFDMRPIKEYGAGPTDNERDTALSHYRELLESLGRLGIKLLCYNFMAGKGWSRTGVREGRGGAKATYFSAAESDNEARSALKLQAPIVEALHHKSNARSLVISHDQIWANYEYFAQSVLPVAEHCSVRMALHPDDPCLDSLDGYARIFGSVTAYDRAYALYPSPANAVTFCQSNFKLMGADLADTARHFGNRIAFVHIRDVEGTKYDFTELFHDQGSTNHFAMMRLYRELGLDVPFRGDHVPEMAGDRLLSSDEIPGYFTLGRLFANGYLKAVLASMNG